MLTFIFKFYGRMWWSFRWFSEPTKKSFAEGNLWALWERPSSCRMASDFWPRVTQKLRLVPRKPVIPSRLCGEALGVYSGWYRGICHRIMHNDCMRVAKIRSNTFYRQYSYVVLLSVAKTARIFTTRVHVILVVPKNTYWKFVGAIWDPFWYVCHCRHIQCNPVHSVGSLFEFFMFRNTI